MLRLLESKFRIDNLLLLDLQVFVEVVQLIIESDEGSSFFVELVFCSLVVVLTVRIFAQVLRRETYLLYTHRLFESSQLGLGLVMSGDGLIDLNLGTL